MTVQTATNGNKGTAPVVEMSPVMIAPVTHQVTLRVYDPEGWDEFYTIKANTVNDLVANVRRFKT